MLGWYDFWLIELCSFFIFEVLKFHVKRIFLFSFLKRKATLLITFFNFDNNPLGQKNESSQLFLLLALYEHHYLLLSISFELGFDKQGQINLENKSLGN